MSALKKVKIALILSLIPSLSLSTFLMRGSPYLSDSLASQTLAKQLGWVEAPGFDCGGYYLEEPFIYPVNVAENNTVEITSNQSLFSQRGTSTLEGKVTVTRKGEQLTGNKAFLYREPTTGKLSTMDVLGDVHLREPNSLIVATQGHYDFNTKMKSLNNILYRTTLNGRQIVGPKIPEQEMQSERKITALTAWGQAQTFSQNEPRVYDLTQTSFTTCPPNHPAWQVRASHIVLNKNTGRGYATNARILVNSVPVFYFPYINFSIDRQRKTGFLWPTFGTRSTWGPYFLAPFYWNMAPNYDMTITPGILTKRGVQLSDNFRYLTHTSSGNVYFSVLPGDRYFRDFQDDAREDPHQLKPTMQAPDITNAEINRLVHDSSTRKAFIWRNDSQYDPHWSSHVDINYAGDDYYLRDFGSNLNEITQNQLLQEGDLYYKSANWSFTGRAQIYQTLHPVQDALVLNQYRRLPQLILNVDYPDQPLGLEYFMSTEATHFEFLNTPGLNLKMPIGDRFHLQPGISLPKYFPYFYFNPRLQFALTQYNLQQTSSMGFPDVQKRALPIFDIASGMSLTRNFALFNYAFEQTLEPEAYYTYIPYRNQSKIPVFDTTVNTLTYDQIFNYNRFSGIDRIGDANQLGVGVATRLIDQETGLEKVRLGVGDIIYFSDRKVTLCNSPQDLNPFGCTDYPGNPNNHYGLSPVSGTLDYHVNPYYKVTANTIWNPITKEVDNSSITLNYATDGQHVVNLSFSFVRNGDYFSGILTNTAKNNLKLTDFSFAWPLTHDISSVARWSHDWNTNHFQNMLAGLQYDTCCWAVRLVGGRSFTNLVNNTPQYSTEYYIQFALKGLGNIGTGNPSGMLSSIAGYTTQFGQEI